LLAAAGKLRPLGTVSVGRRYEFAHDPAAVVVLQVVLPLAVGLAANALYDALRRFIRPERSTVFQFHVEHPGGVVDARLETSDAATLRSALNAFDQLVNPDSVLLVWDEAIEQWRSL